jgi:acetolactate synthase-1/2/3 large subunit
MGVGSFPETHPLSMQWFGMHGSAYGNWAVDQSDLLLCFGARFDDRITGDTKHFAAQAKIVHLDIDASEHNKNKARPPADHERRQVRPRPGSWRSPPIDKFTPPDTACVARPDRHLEAGASVLRRFREEPAHRPAGGGAGALRADQGRRHHHHRRRPAPDVGRAVLPLSTSRAATSARSGSARWASATRPRMGAKVACPDKQVIDIDGDGSFVMNIQELATCHIEKIAAKAMILNNQHLGMVVQWEDRFYGSVRGNTILGDESNVGSPDNPRASTRTS